MKTIFILLAVMLLTGCSRATKVTVVNASGVELTNVVASGNGFSVSIGTIPAGEERRIQIRSNQASDLQLGFQANGKQLTSAPDGYFENGAGYKVTATVGPDLSVKVTSGL